MIAVLTPIALVVGVRIWPDFTLPPIGPIELIPSRTRSFPQVDNRRIPEITTQDTPKDTTKVITQVVHRLSPEAYAQLEQQCGSPAVSPLTTDTQAAHALGVQFVLAVLRRGFVTGA